MSDASQGAQRTQGRVGAVNGGRWRVDARIGAVLAPLRSRRDDLANRRKALVTERQTLVAGG